MAFDKSKFLARFVDEAREHCAKLSEGLLALESGPGDAEAMNAIFRSAHTIKGSARMMKLTGISELAHSMEDVLDATRSGRIALTRPMSDLLFQGIDALSAMLDQVQAGDKPDAPAHLRQQLLEAAKERPTAGEADSLEQQTAPEPPVEAAPTAAEPAPEEVPSPSAQQASGQTGPASQVSQVSQVSQAAGPASQAQYLRVNAAKLDELIRLMGEILSEQSRIKRTAQMLRSVERQARQHARRAARLPDRPGDAQDALRHGADEAAALSAALRRCAASLKDGVTMQDHLMSELQDTSLKLRMLPLATVFDPLRRTVRDLSREYGKAVEFIIQGGETELDRKIAERLGDPLLHLIRNALDHGMETPEERARTGKPGKGALSLSAFYDRGGVTIALSDDGRGLGTERIREKALAKRLFDAETLSRMSRAEVHQLIFLPGFSTSPIITDISGRGVGMDVVRNIIADDLKGAIILDTKEGQGTTFLLRLPLTLAMIPLFLVRARQTVYALPATAIVEMLAVDREEIIEIVGKSAIRLREQIVPVEDLGTILGQAGEDASKQAKATIVVVRDGENKLGLLVDEIVGSQEMVVKPLPGHLKNHKLVTGGTIGEGGVIVNVLHLPELMRMARDQAGESRTATLPKGEHGARILVVDDSVNTREIEKSILEAYGYTVATAGDGQEALEMARGERFDLVITDVEMPRLDGFSLTERLRADQRYGNVPIIIVTSLEKDADKRRGIAIGADAYIVKRAFDQSNLLDTVKSLIG